ncbi:MAG: universal stress protein [Campylobacterales bacterium]|nr:universal stress protein [Campylobacterales bacterium]
METIKHILAVIDDKPRAEDILKKSLELAKQFNANLVVLHTIHIPFLRMPAYVQDVPVNPEEIREQIDDKIGSLKEGEAIIHHTMVYFGDATERAIVEAKRDDIDLIVSSSEMNFEKMVNEVQKPILVINSDYTTYQKLLIPTDLSDQSKAAIGYAQSLFGEVAMSLVYGYERITMVTSMYDISYADMIEYQEENKDIAENLLANFSQEVGIEGELIEATFSLGDRIVEYIGQQSPDLVVVAAGSADDIFNFGSISSYIAKASSKDVLIFC